MVVVLELIFLRGWVLEKSTFFQGIDTPFVDLWASRPREKSKQNQDRETPHTVLQKLSAKPTRTPLGETLNEGGGCQKNQHFFLKNWHPVCGPMSFVAKGVKKKIMQCQDKETPHTVIRKLSRNPTCTPLMVPIFTNIKMFSFSRSPCLTFGFFELRNFYYWLWLVVLSSMRILHVIGCELLNLFSRVAVYFTFFLFFLNGNTK